jgi:pilus assembly protein CpaF
MITLTIEGHDKEKSNHSLDLGAYKVGRSLWSDIRIKHPSILKHHLTLEVAEEGFVVLSKGILLHNSVEHERLSTPDSGAIINIGDISICIEHQYKQTNCLNELPEQKTLADNTYQENITGSMATQDTQKRQETDELTTKQAAEQPQESEQWIALKKQLQHAVLEKLDLYKRTMIDGFDDVQLREEATQTAKSIVAEGGITLPKNTDQARLFRETVAESIGLGPLEPLLADESISEIMVNGPQQIYIEKYGRLEQTTTRFTSESSLMSVIERIVSPLGRRIDEGSPMVDARLADGSRVNAIIRPLSLIGPVMTIRKFSKDRYDLQKLVDYDSLSPEMAEFLQICIHHKKNIVVSGGTGSGKTTFLNALSDCIPDNERIITIEDAAELQLGQQHVISLESRPANTEQRGAISIRELVRNALRMRPDRIIVGECRGGEALDMLQAMNTGHDGSLTTAHANSPRDLLSRLEVMVLMAGMDLPVKVVREQISSAVDIVIQQSRFADGKRRVTSIVEIDGMEQDVVLMQKIFEYRQTGIDKEGTLLGHYKGMNIAPRFYTELQESGIELDRSIFMTQIEI